jgi:hypothetical protein
MNEEIMKAVGAGSYVEAVKQKCCPLCLKPIDEKSFRDALSLKDYKITGCCQKCQDKLYGV